MHEFRPVFIPHPQGRAAMPAETSFGRAFLAVDHRVPCADGAAALDFQRREIAHDVDGVTAAAGALAADRAVAALVRVGGVAVEREFDGAAAARAFETHRHGATPPSAASSERSFDGPADNRAGRIPGSRTSDRTSAPETKMCREKRNGSRT